MPEPPGGFLETQLEETQNSQSGRSPSWELVDGDDQVEEDAGNETPAHELPKSFPELVKAYQEEGYSDLQVRVRMLFSQDSFS
jgi:hypothetical protein